MSKSDLFVVFLRAVNVGGSNIMRMKSLVEALLAEETPCLHAQSYLQSGNLVLQLRRSQSAEAVVQFVRDAIKKNFSCEPTVIVRSIEDVQKSLNALPFSDAEPNKVQIHFLDTPADPLGARALESYDKGPETVVVMDQEVFVHYVNGIGRSQFSRVPLEKMLKAKATARNINTIRAVLKIGRDMRTNGTSNKSTEDGGNCN